MVVEIKDLGGEMIEVLGVVYVNKFECDRHARAEYIKGLEKGTTIHKVEPITFTADVVKEH